MDKSTSDNAAQGRAGPAPGAQALDVAELSGSWVNTEPTPAAIARLTIEPGDGAPRIRTVAADPGDQGDAQADGLYATSPTGREAVGFTAAYQGPGGEVGLHANLSKGLLIVASFTRHPGGQAAPGNSPGNSSAGCRSLPGRPRPIRARPRRG